MDSSKLCATSTMWWRCGSFVFSRCFHGFLRFARNIRRCWRLVLLSWSAGWIPRNCTQIRPCGGAAGRLSFSDVSMDSCVSLGTFAVCCRLEMLLWSPRLIPRNCTRSRACGGAAGRLSLSIVFMDSCVSLRPSSLLAPCDAVVVSSVDSSKQ